MSEAPRRVRARVQKTRKVYVHNDLSQAATYFADTIEEKEKKGTRDAIMFDGMATAVFVAFAFEAKLNFMGSQLFKYRKPTEWYEFQSHTKKLKKVFEFSVFRLRSRSARSARSRR